MSDASNPLVAALEPLLLRVRTTDTWVRTPEGPRHRPAEPLTRERLASHLNGGPARGVCPMAFGASDSRIGMLDLDNHRGESTWVEMARVGYRICESLEVAWGAHPVAFRSTGGKGIHIYVAWPVDAPQDAYSIQQWFAGALEPLGLRVGVGGVMAGLVEVFPKNRRVLPTGSTPGGKGETGSMFVLPLAGNSELLLPDDVGGTLAPADRELRESDWVDSPPIARRVPPVRVVNAGSDWGAGAVWRAALEALAADPGANAALADREPWRNVLFALHHESGGSEDGRTLAHAWSARLPQYDGEEVDKLWDGADTNRDGAITSGTIVHLANMLAGWTKPIEVGAEFGPVDDPETIAEPGAGAGGAVARQDGPGSPGAVAGHVGSGPGVAGAPATGPVRRRGIPAAQHLCTDQANANRIVKAYGAHLMVCADQWYVWDERRWLRDEGEVYRRACQLGRLVKAEARAVREKASAGGADVAALRVAGAVAEALDKWSTRSEMKGAIEAAIGLARKMLTVESGSLDADPWALNVRNGTVDLRTGGLRPHRLEDRITRLVDVDYVPGARSSVFERFLSDVCSGDGVMVGFIKRWIGYCLTGSTREQKFAVLWGSGGNGKSTLVAAVDSVMGDYAGTAAAGLMVKGRHGGDVHSSAVVALVGKRLMTAHESSENVTLDEAFVKRATGSDKMEARFLFGEQFEFAPTHKLQLLTNNKPTIRGQDFGMWRRVVLIAFLRSWGSVEEVAAGLAHEVGDRGIGALLATREAREGILATLVKDGAVEWFTGGLREPDSVLAAKRDYQGEQDRTRQFVAECCELGAAFSERLATTMGDGLYPAYQAWCRAAGVLPCSKLRFVKDLERCVPGFRADEMRLPVSEGRAKVRTVHGIRLAESD